MLHESPYSTEEACPVCGVMLAVEEEPLFSMVRCPKCQNEVRVRRVAGSYLLLDVLGQGGSGRVFHARREVVGHDVAVKILEKRSPEYEENLQLLRNEALCAQLVDHPRVVKVLALEEDEGGARLVMELMEGGSLHDLIVSGEKITEEFSLMIGLEILKALEEVDSMGMVHRDLKPANILFNETGGAKLGDFGLARGLSTLSVTQSHLLATPDYVAPEILDGFQGDLRSDFYGLGGCLHHALAGTPPYSTEGLSVSELLVLKATPADLGRGYTEVTRSLISQMMDPDPARRFQSCGELETAFLSALHGLIGFSNSEQNVTRSRRGRRHRSQGLIGFFSQWIK